MKKGLLRARSQGHFWAVQLVFHTKFLKPKLILINYFFNSFHIHSLSIFIYLHFKVQWCWDIAFHIYNLKGIWSSDDIVIARL